MLCCGRKKDNRVISSQRIIGESNSLGTKYMTYPGYQACYADNPQMPTVKRNVHFPTHLYVNDGSRQPEMVLQGDFRKVSGITSEIFRQIEAVERDYMDPTTAAHLEFVEKRGEMKIRLLDPRSLGTAGAEIAKKYLCSSIDESSSVQFVEIVKRPGQTLGLYIREGDGIRKYDGVFISRIALESPVFNSGLLKVGNEILAVNLVDVRRMSLDDVVIIMSIPRRLVLTIRTHHYPMGTPDAMMMANRHPFREERQLPVVVVKKEFQDELDTGGHEDLSNRDPENGHLIRARLKGLTSDGIESLYSESPYSFQRRVVPRSRDDAWLTPRNRGYSMLAGTHQPLSLQRLTRASDSLSGGLSQVYPSGYAIESPYSSLRRNFTLAGGSLLNRSMFDRVSPSRLRFLDDYSSLTRRFNRLSRTESDNCINPFARDYVNSYITRPRSRTSTLRSLSSDYHAPFHHKRINDIRSLSTRGSSGVLARRNISDGSVSDTEIGGSYSSYRLRRKIPSSRLHRTESDNCIAPLAREYINSTFSRPRSRASTLRSSDYHALTSIPNQPDRDWNKLDPRNSLARKSNTIASANPISGSDGHLSVNDRTPSVSGREEEESNKDEEGLNGILWINIIAGRGLRSGSVPSTTRDLYCVIECDRVHKARTVVRSGESNFDWDEIFELDLVETKTVSFLLYSWDPQYRHKLCYKGSIKLLNLSIRDPTVHSATLKMEPKGTLYIKLRYKDISVSFQRIHIQPSSANLNTLFGCSLESVVIRENSGFNLPLIVKKCTQEVEERGVNLVGIYRLCASAVRKKILREAFEKDSVIVDLSAEHVPDINVITSLLKDYVRELPEPLFTKALFDMMVDGLGVCLPGDGPGKAKLMFSILECLPKINRATVLYLMDHIKFVESHSKRNKMNAQALAVAFGPIFTCHSESDSFRKPIEVFKNLLDIWPVKESNSERKRADSLK